MPRLALTLVVVAGLAVALDVDRLVSALSRIGAEPGIVCLAAGAYTVAFWLRAVALRRLLARDGGAAPPVGSLFSVIQAGLVLNHLLPAKAGDIVRPALLARYGVPVTTGIASTVVTRVLDLGALLLITIVVNAVVLDVREVAAQLRDVIGAPPVLIAAGLGVVAAAAMARAWPQLPGRWREVAASAIRYTRSLTPATLGMSATLLAGAWILESAVLVAGARLMGLDLPVLAAIGATAFAVTFQAIHVTPGGLGVYEASMTGILVLHGLPPEQALALAVLTHGLKFAYAFTIAAACALPAAIAMLRGRSGGAPRVASRLEVIAARSWNVLNEGKPFTPVFALGVIALLVLSRLGQPGILVRSVVGIAAVVPLALLWWRYDFPLRLRAVLWVALAAWVLVFRSVSVPALVLVVSLYFFFTVVMWGTVYYHLRIGTRWTNFTRFTRLVLENPDPTSGNALEQLPKAMLLTWMFELVSRDASWSSVAAVEVFTAVVALAALAAHQWWWTWIPALPQRGLRGASTPAARVSDRVIVIAIDGCRADRLREAHTPFLDRLRAEGADFTNVSTVYPARTVTAFASMLTGAPPEAHGMRSNFVPYLGVRCESVFDVLRARGMKGVLVGIAHLIDAFGERDVRTVTAVMDNDSIDGALVARAKRVLEEEAPELLVLQLLSVDQTGHSRGSYREEYLRQIEVTDCTIEEFVTWCGERGYLDNATILVTSDHGQGIGIGGHGHMSPPEITVPCVWWGAGMPSTPANDGQRFITEIAPTIAGLLGCPEPAATVGRAMLPVATYDVPGPVVFVLPARNEAPRLPGVLAAIARSGVDGRVAIVVDDGSTDGTGRIAEAAGATVVRHELSRGLGAALRTGLAAARDLCPRAVVYLDADGEYDATEAAALLVPIERGEADYVIGSRFLGKPQGMTRARRVANTLFSALLSLCAGRWTTDGQSGFRAFSGRAVDVAEIVHDYNYAQVLTLDLLHKGMRMAEVPITYRKRSAGASFVNVQYLWRVPLGMAREMLKG